MRRPVVVRRKRVEAIAAPTVFVAGVDGVPVELGRPETPATNVPA